jgi:hypothetical protein
MRKQKGERDVYACLHAYTVFPVYARYGAALLGRLTEWLKSVWIGYMDTFFTAGIKNRS